MTLIPEFAKLPLPEDVDTCDDVQTPFCLFAEACAPCDAEFEALVTCFVLQSDNISPAVTDLVNGCSLGCDDAAADADGDMMDADGEDIDVDVDDDDALSNSTEMMIEDIVDVTVSGIRVDVTVTTTGNATANETETNEETEEAAANEAE